MLTEQEPSGTNQEVVHFILKLIWSDEDAIFLFYLRTISQKNSFKFKILLWIDLFEQARGREVFAEKLPISPQT